MSSTLPLRAHLDWLKKVSKERLETLRATDPSARLADAQLAVAREYGFASWRKLKEEVDRRREKLEQLLPGGRASAKEAAAIAPDDAELVRLVEAVKAGDVKMAGELLTRRPALAAARDAHGQTPLHVAAECDDARLGAYLLAVGADPEARFGQSGHTALSWAVTCHGLDFARAVRKLGVAADLFCAAGMGDLEAVRAFFDDTGALRPGASRTGSSRFARDGSRLPCPPATAREQISDALVIAARNAHAGVVRELLAHDPDLAFDSYMGGQALHWAHYGGSREIIRMLEDAGADAESRDNALGCTPRAFGICVPASWGFVSLVRARLDADPSLARYTDGHTSALHEAAREGATGVVQLLLERGADPAMKNGDGLTAAEVAAAGRHDAVAALLGA